MAGGGGLVVGGGGVSGNCGGGTQGYRKFETVQYNRILNLELSDETRKISQHVDKVSKLSKICLYTLQDNLEQYNHPSIPFYCSSILPSALGFFFVV